MPRITKSGPVLSTATKLYLITSTVATGVGGGFLFPVVPPCRYPRHRGSADPAPPLSLPPLAPPLLCHRSIIAIPVTPHHDTNSPEKATNLPGGFRISRISHTGFHTRGTSLSACLAHSAKVVAGAIAGCAPRGNPIRLLLGFPQAWTAGPDTSWTRL